MKLIGNLLDIRNRRDDRNKGIELHIDQVEYVTQRKDGKYFQEFSYVDELESPLILTGDCLARTTNKSLEANEYEFQVYDKTEHGYELNPNKYLSVLLMNDVDLDEPVLTSVYYTIAVPPEELKQIELQKTKEKSFRNRRDRKRKK